MVCRRDNRQEDPRRVPDTQHEEGNPLRSGPVGRRGLAAGLLKELGRCGTQVLLIRAGHGQPGLAGVARLAEPTVHLLCATKRRALVDEDTSDAERITKVHAGHGGQTVNKVSAHPDRCRILAVDGVDEAILLRQQARGHARVKDEDGKGEQVAQGHGSAGRRESAKGRGYPVVKGDESMSLVDIELACVTIPQASLRKIKLLIGPRGPKTNSLAVSN